MHTHKTLILLLILILPLSGCATLFPEQNRGICAEWTNLVQAGSAATNHPFIRIWGVYKGYMIGGKTGGLHATGRWKTRDGEWRRIDDTDFSRLIITKTKLFENKPKTIADYIRKKYKPAERDNNSK